MFFLVYFDADFTWKICQSISKGTFTLQRFWVLRIHVIRFKQRFYAPEKLVALHTKFAWTELRFET